MMHVYPQNDAVCQRDLESPRKQYDSESQVQGCLVFCRPEGYWWFHTDGTGKRDSLQWIHMYSKTSFWLWCLSFVLLCYLISTFEAFHGKNLGLGPNYRFVLFRSPRRKFGELWLIYQLSAEFDRISMEVP